MDQKIIKIGLYVLLFIIFFGIIYLLIPSVALGIMGALILLVLVKWKI